VYPDPKWQQERFQVYSNKMAFEVRKPSGREREANKLLVEGYKKLFLEIKKDEGREMLRKIISEYSGSVYRDAAYAIASYHFHDRKSALEFISENPNSGFVTLAIFTALPKSGKPLERKEFLQGIINKDPNTKAGIYAENYLDKWRRGKLWVDEPIPGD
jgi:hypothetical protein